MENKPLYFDGSVPLNFTNKELVEQKKTVDVSQMKIPYFPYLNIK